MNFEIILDNYRGVILAGSEVTGTVDIHVSQRTSTDRIVFKAKGKAKTRIIVPGYVSNQNQMRWCKGVDKYLDVEYVLWQGKELLPGKHRFPFKFLLPPNCPASGNFGCGRILSAGEAWVSYTVKVEIVRSWYHSNHKKKVSFTVQPIMDLNIFPMNRHVVTIPIKEHGIIGEVCLPRTGFTIGEDIIATLVMQNTNSRPVVNAALKLFRSARMTARYNGKMIAVQGRIVHNQEFTLFGHDITRIQEEIAVKSKMDINLLGRSSKDYQLCLRLPLRLSCTNNISPILQIEYLLVVKIKVQGTIFNHRIEKKIPVVIGTIPYRNVPPPFNPNPQPSYNPSLSTSTAKIGFR